jgi:hypothetical protein
MTESKAGSATAEPRPYKLIDGTPDRLDVTTLAGLLEWFADRLCGRHLTDPRGQRVYFLDTDFVHLIKLVDRYGKEPKNTRMTIQQIRSGRVLLNPSRMSIQRAQELSWAEQIITSPDLIVPNWQAMGRANPGDAYIRNFGAAGAKHVYRVLVCGHEGRKRRVVTIFPRERFAADEIKTLIWP